MYSMHLSLHIDQTQIQAGGTVSGKLQITAKRSTPARELLLYLKAKEYTSVVHSGQVSQDQHQFLRLDASVSPGIIRDHQVKPGSYEVPFSFPIPLGVPPSMEVTKHHRAKRNESASIAYRVRAVLVGSGKIEDYSVQQTITVVAPPVPPKHPHTIAPFIASPVLHTLPNEQGEITCGVKIWDTQLLSGQQPQIQLSILNDSTTAISKVELALEQEVAWWAAKKRISNPVSAPFHSTSTTQTLCSQTVPLLDASIGKPILDASQKRLPNPSRPQEKYQQIQNDLGPLDKVPVYTLPPVPITDPKPLISFQGQKIGVVHQIRLTLIAAGEGKHQHRWTQLVPVKISPGEFD